MKVSFGRILCVSAAVALCTLTRAAVTVGENVQVAGFFSQGYLTSNGNNYPTTNAKGSDEFREMAVNASTSLGSHVRLGAQLFAERFGPYGDDKVLLDWAVADYNFGQAFGIRVGRVKMPKSLYSEALDLDMLRPFVFLPGFIYSSVLRDFSASFDGGMLYGSFPLGGGSVDYKVYYGDVPMKPEQGVADFYNNTGIFALPGGVTKLGVDYTAGAALVWNTPVSGLKLCGYLNRLEGLGASGRFAFAPAALAVAPVEIKGHHYDNLILAAEYVVGKWTIAAEFQHARDQATLRSPLLPLTTAPGGVDSWYLSVARRLNSRVEVGASYSSQKDPNAAVTAPRASTHTSNWSLGMRFDINEHLLFKIEADYVDGTMGMLNTPRLPNPVGTRKDQTLFWAAKSTLSF